MYYMQINKNLCVKLEIKQGYTTMYGQLIIKNSQRQVICCHYTEKHVFPLWIANSFTWLFALF